MDDVATKLNAHLVAKGAHELAQTQIDAINDGFYLADPPSVINEVESLRNEVKTYRAQLLEAETQRNALRDQAAELRKQVDVLTNERDVALSQVAAQQE